MFSCKIHKLCHFQLSLQKFHKHGKNTCQAPKGVQRKKKNESLGKTWLASESNRTKKYYKKVSTLSTSEAKQRRKQLREKQASYRARKYLERSVNNEAQQGTTLSTAHNDIQTNEVSSTSTDSRPIVKLAYHKKHK
jgi:hypothetical protein